MKRLLFLLALTGALLSGCGKSPKPDDVIYNTETFQDGYKPGPTVKDNPVPVMVTKVTLKPTWKQSNRFASLRGDYGLWQVLGVLGLLLLIGFVYCWAANVSWFPNLSALAFGVCVALLGCLSLASFKWQAASIKWNNEVKVEKEYFDRTIESAGSSRPIWDSLENGCHITWGPYKCFEK